MNENRLTLKIQKHLVKRGAYAEVIWGGGFQKAGIPDILACYRGVFLGLEVKTEDGVTSRIQEEKMKLIRKAGGVAYVVRSISDVDGVINMIDMRR